MSNDNGFLSQEEIDALLNGGDNSKGNDESEEKAPEQNDLQSNETTNANEEITDVERDILGEIGNISMGSASTALSTIIGQKVNITTPQVKITSLSELKDTFQVPNIALEVKFTSGIMGENLLVMKITDAAVIANLMMGGDGKVEEHEPDLSEIEESAVSEAMNQMIGSAATSMATMFAREVNISPPESKIWRDTTAPLAEGITEDEKIIQVLFKLTIGDLVDSNIMQILPINTAKKIVSIMMGKEDNEASSDKVDTSSEEKQVVHEKVAIDKKVNETPIQSKEPVQQSAPQPVQSQPQVNVQQASFDNLQETNTKSVPQNIDLILDVPLEISVVLGRTKKNIKEVLNLGTGSLIELDKLAEEPVEILVNGKKVAYGEVVVVDENFGVRILNIVNSEERIKSLKK